MRGTAALYLRFMGMALRRPLFVRDIAGAAWAFRGEGWYRRAPFLPIPPASYIRWRMDTAYGDPGALPPTAEGTRFLRWASTMRRNNKRRL